MNKYIKKSLFLIVVLLCIQLSINSYAFANTNNKLQECTNKKIEELITKQMKKGKIPGLSVTIVNNQDTVYKKGFGYSNKETKKAVDDDTVFEIGSNSKAFTALGILKLESEGKLSLNDSITKYIPWLKMKYKGKYTDINIEQVYHQTSGIPFGTINEIPESNSNTSLNDTVKTLVNTELDSLPGEKFQYATINYDILGLIIEKVSGESYEQYMKNEVIKPLGLDNTYLSSNSEISSKIATGYRVSYLDSKEYKAPTYKGNTPAGYILSCGKDMEKWLKLQIGTINTDGFDSSIIKRSHEINNLIMPFPNGSSYAGGWYVSDCKDKQISHGGNNPNFSSHIIINRDDNTGIAVLANSNSPYVESICESIDDIIHNRYYDINATNVKDMNITSDYISVSILLVTIVIVIFTLIFIVMALVDIKNKKRHITFNGIKSILKIFISFMFMLGLCYCIKSLPFNLYSGVSWDFVFVWLAGSIKYAYYALYAGIWTIYIFAIFTSIFKKDKDKAVLLLIILSCLSGLGNALIIFTINSAVSASNEVRLKLLIYFALGMILYVYGQKIMREKLIGVTNKIVYEKRMNIASKLLNSRFKKFEEINRGRIQATINDDPDTISRFVNILINGLTSAITLICCCIYLGSINKYALLLAVVIIMLIASIYYFVGRFANRTLENSRDLQNVFFTFINDLIMGFKELSLNKKKKSEFKNDLNECCDKYRIKRGEAAQAWANMFVIGELLFTLAIGSVVFVFPIVLKTLENNQIASYVFILLYMTGPVHGILDTIPELISVKVALKRINGLLEEVEKYTFDDNREGLSSNDSINLKLDNVEYCYDENDCKAFKIGPLNYEFKSGEITFITGGNGSGKSTLAKLLTGLYSPTKGYVSLNDNKNPGKILCESYTTVFSDFHIFEKLYGIDYENKMDEINKYLKILQLDKKVTIDNGKFSTTKLSTGQRKRLALLITYLEDRPIYLFDEWAADQDPEFRKFFYNTLLPELKERGKCVIAVTHDEFYFERADNIIKMDMGQMVYKTNN